MVDCYGEGGVPPWRRFSLHGYAYSHGSRIIAGARSWPYVEPRSDMKQKRKRQGRHRIHQLIGDDAFLRLVEKFGGNRIYVSRKNVDGNLLGDVLDQEAIESLIDEYGGLHMRVPIAREFRALHYREQGLSNRKIAARLGMTEPGLNQLFGRLKLAHKVPAIPDASIGPAPS